MGARSRSALLTAMLALLVGLLYAPQATGQQSDPDPAAKAAGTFRNPLNSGPDPFMAYANGAYHLATTQGDSIKMWRSKSMSTLLETDPITVWTDDDASRNQHMWAPEFYHFGDRWYLYYTADDGEDDHHRLFVLESEADDPAGPYHFKAKLEPPNHKDTFAIDPGILQHNGKLYLAYSGINAYQHNGLNIAPMSNPYTVSGDAVAIDAAGGCPEVREGPAFLNRNGRTWMTYSACDTGKPDYQVWMMSLPDDADPMVPGNWSQHEGPVFSRADDRGVFGPGHHSFFTSPDGTEDWLIYHAKTTAENTYTNRTTRAQKISWKEDGSPDLGTPQAMGATQNLPAGDPGSGNHWINDDGRSSGDATVEYTGTWNSGAGCAAQCFFGDDHWSDQAGDTATFRFTGTRIVLLSVQDTGNGIAAISVDGGPEERVDFHGPIRTGETVQYRSPKLSPGPHTVQVRVTGEHNDSSDGAFVSVDRAEVYTD
ncbi:Extracellular exo-alpha-(1-_5)-L-arabinofuranosidase precursor [Streptomyces sp. YIM 130001]|uniref:glycoside hydrolase family 43 protein n=1 Tax=Streptomyces sp. YIM 130001 TaxID=2259644 RepID=UPI000E646F6D|nr:glycoside hydrolase family 43 protein [Streptomyces sp. YIM 130001]RII20424.1 Extracellular exo-alpha-(1->5)-L-arabinofuranosidase precursor [Streptomyces sp. YIM 130001]